MLGNHTYSLIYHIFTERLQRRKHWGTWGRSMSRGLREMYISGSQKGA